MKDSIKYSKKNYKYVMEQDYTRKIEITGFHIDTEYVKLSKRGFIWTREKYAWDGPSGPAIDTKSFMIASLVHDALYQLIRLGHLPQSYRLNADQEMYKKCIEDGMFFVRAWLAYKTVRAFGSYATKKNKVIYVAP